jgi:hypothetical protein
MLRRMSLLLTAVFAVAAHADDRPILGDVVHGQQIYSGDVRVDGAWLNRYPDDVIIKLLQKGTEGFPAVDSDNALDRWDVLALLRSKNTDLRDLSGNATHVLIADTTLDDGAQKRLAEQAKLNTFDKDRRVYVLYKLDDDNKGAAGKMTFVSLKESKKRDALKKDKKLGYVVFAKLDLRGGTEVAFAVDKDIRITDVLVRAKDGSVPVDLQQAAKRFIGKGARGKYDEVRAGGAGKAVGELSTSFSNAFLAAMESVYMYEIDEREYFQFD